MSIIVYSISVALALLSCALYVDAGKEKLQKYCSTLNQTEHDTNQCYEKPRQYVADVDTFILAYMCCFGYFGDVTYDYTPFISFSFVLWLAKLTNVDTLQKIAEFLQVCNKVLKGRPALTEGDYSYWEANKRVPCGCKVPSQ